MMYSLVFASDQPCIGSAPCYRKRHIQGLEVLLILLNLAVSFNPYGSGLHFAGGGSARASSENQLDDCGTVAACSRPCNKLQRLPCDVQLCRSFARVPLRGRGDRGRSFANADRGRSGQSDQQEMPPYEQAANVVNHHGFRKEDRILFTCTTFLSKPGKREIFEEVIASLDPVLGDFCTRCLIVNEYDESGQDHSDIVRNYPKFEFYQKSEHQRGQAASLNLILDELEASGFEYWLQWEEAWKPKRDFFPEALDIMKASNLAQLQFSQPWLYLPNCKLEEKDGYFEITKTHDDYPEWQCAEKWPLFSLQPGLNRAASILRCGRFDTDPDNWPYQFEYMFALEFVKLNLTKGMIKGGAALCVEGHISTHKDAEQKAREDEERNSALRAIMSQEGGEELIAKLLKQYHVDSS